MGSKKSGPEATQIDPAQTLGKVINLAKSKTLPFLNEFMGSNPQIEAMTSLANRGLAQLPGLQSRLQTGYNAATAYMPMAIRALQGNWEGVTPTSQLTDPLKAAMPTAAGIAASGGALGPEFLRQATQDSAARSAMGGMATTIPGLFNEALNRDRYREVRYNNAIGQLLGLTQGISGLDTAGLGQALTYGGGLTGYGGTKFQDIQQLIQGQQGLIGNAMQQQGNVIGTGVDVLGKLIDPSASTVSSATAYNANAEQAARNAASNKQTGTLGAIGSIAGAVGIAL